MFDDPARQRRSDAFNFRSQIAFERGDAGRPQRFEVVDLKLLAVTRMFLETPSQSQAGANLDPAKIANDGDTGARPFVVATLNHRDRIAVGLVDEKQLIKGALNLMGVRSGGIHSINRFDGVSRTWKWRLRTAMNSWDLCCVEESSGAAHIAVAT